MAQKNKFEDGSYFHDVPMFDIVDDKGTIVEKSVEDK